MKLLNLDILKNPVNWFVVIMMLVIAAIGGHLILHLAGIHPATNSE